MTETYFRSQLGRIYATFGKAWPQAPVIAQIFKQVCDFPEGFMDYALSRCELMESLPQNLGRFLARELWPDYRVANPAIAASEPVSACPRCRYNYPGVKDFYTPDGEIKLCACDCCRDERIIALMGQYPDWELLERGYLLENPIEPDPAGFARFARKLRKNASLPEETRPRHEAYMQSVEAGCEFGL